MVKAKWVGLFRSGTRRIRITKFFKGSDDDCILEQISSYIAFQSDCLGRTVIEHKILSIRKEKEHEEVAAS